MVKDRLFRWIGIPLLGFFVPVVAGLVKYRSLDLSTGVVSMLLFLFISFAVWTGSVSITTRLHGSSFCKNVAVKLYAIIAATSIYSFCLIAALSLVWQLVVTSGFHLTTIVNTGLIGCGVATFFSLVYEIL